MQEATVQSQEFPLLSRTFPVHILHSCVFQCRTEFSIQAHPFLVKLAMAIFILFFCLSEFGGKRRIVEITSAVISLGNGISDDHQRCLGDLVLFRRLGKCSNGADERLLLRPGCFVNDRCRSICPYSRLQSAHGKVPLRVPCLRIQPSLPDVPQKRRNALPLRNRCSSGHSGDDNTLGDIRQRIFHFKGSSRSQKELTPGQSS